MNKGEKGMETKLKKGLWILGILIALLVLILLLNAVGFFGAISMVLSSLQAVLFGIFFACLLSPMMRGFERLLSRRIGTTEKPRKDLIKGISILLSLAVMIFIIVSVLLLVIPQLGITLEKIIPSFRGMIQNFNEWLSGLSKAEFWKERVYPMIEEFTTNMSSIILRHFGVGTEFYTNITGGIMATLSTLFNLVIGMILSIYLLLEKDKIFAMIRKISLALFKEKWGGYVMSAVDEGARIFSGFFGAKILEAIILGVLCFFGMIILNLPYATLVSVLVGFANIIPFFGPYIGALLGAAIIILVDPWQALWFIIFQIVLVQFDANLIGPKILGHSTGLSALWVIVAILLFSGCFGFIGALIGVPIFAWIYYVVKRIIAHLLAKQGKPTDTEYYIELAQEEQQLTKKKKKESSEKC